MLSFGLSLGNPRRCPTPPGELFRNRHFDCGADYWETNAYGGTITTPARSLVTLTATDAFSSLTQTHDPLPAGSYHLGVAVTEISGNGKFSYKLQDGTWHNPITFSAPGTYEADITVDQEIVTFDIGADNDATAVITFDGISCMDASVIHFPDWWSIDTLDPVDILGAWDFASVIHADKTSALTNLHGTMPSFAIAAGSPGWSPTGGIMFGGGGALKSLLPDGIDHNNITVLIQVNGILQNASLDAIYSHFKGHAHYTLQNGWGTPALRWSCGDGSSTTIEAGGVVTSGVIATAGRTIYVDGTNLGEVPESAEALTNGDSFILGAIQLDDGRTVQFMRGYVLKLLIVKRLLTEAEVQEITSNMTGSHNVLTTDDGEPLTTDDGEPLWL